MNPEVKSVEFTLDRRTEAVLLKIGYVVEGSTEDGAPLTVQIVWINPANIRSTLTEDEWDTIHAFLYREEQLHLQRGLKKLDIKRSSLDPYI